MAYNYDELYRSTPNALGEPTQVFVDFFNRPDLVALRVLDVGCGQGRDALFIARKGHSVVGVDISPSGISALEKAASAERIRVEGIVADIRGFKPANEFDVVLLDRTLHMLPEQDRLAVLERLLGHVATKGYILIADEKANIPAMKNVVAKSGESWIPVLEKAGYLFLQRK